MSALPQRLSNGLAPKCSQRSQSLRFARFQGRRSSRIVATARPQRGEAQVVAAKAPTGDWASQAPFLEPFVRSFILGVGAGAILEGGHVAMQVLAGSFPGVSNFSPLLVADHVTAFASWIALYTIEAVAILSVLKRFDWNTEEAAKDISTLSTLPQKMLPVRLGLFKNLFKAGKKLQAANSTASAAATTSAISTVSAATAAAAPSADEATQQAPAPRVSRAPVGSSSTILPAPQRKGAPQKPPQEDDHAAQHRKRAKELSDRKGYLTNMWYAVALSEKVDTEPVQVQLCGKEMVLWRSADGTVNCIDNACPHRGAPLHQGWVDHKKDGHSCIVCPYHGWAMDGDAALHDVPAAVNKGEWPKRPLSDAYPVEEKGGFVWLFYGSKNLPADARPPIPFTPELEDPEWQAVYEEIEFDCGHFGVFENAIDMAHIHYLHGDSFGNGDKPEIRDMECTNDAYSITATFKICNKPVNAFWALFQVPEVNVTAKAFVPSTSYVGFTLGNGLSFITFVNTIPISENKCINRFALVRKLSWDKTGIFNMKAWDGMARDAMMKIQTEDKEMVEQLKYNQLPAEYSVRADLPQVMFRKLRQQYVDLGYLVPTENERPPYTISNKDL